MLYRKLPDGGYIEATRDEVQARARELGLFARGEDSYEELAALPFCADCPCNLECPRQPRCNWDCGQDMLDSEKF